MFGAGWLLYPDTPTGAVGIVTGALLPYDFHGASPMLSTIAVILILLWLFGMVSSYTMGGLIHILLVIAIIMVLVRVIQGRRPIP